MLNIKDLRKEYSSKSLDIKDLNADPFLQFERWFKESQACQIEEPNAMVLATSSNLAKPSIRTVLLKVLENQRFTFFTNTESRKAKEMGENTSVAAIFLWKELERQVIIEGSIEIAPIEIWESYFHSRPRKSQLSAFISKQSRIVQSRFELDQLFEKATLEFEGKEIPFPAHWGGYSIIPNRFEFWQGRSNRLHDRLEYTWQEEKWHINRLFP